MKKKIRLTPEQKKLVESHLSIVYWIIRKDISVNDNVYGLGYDDLYQEGCLWLCHAAVSYNAGLAKFPTYAKKVVRNGLLSYCRKMYAEQKYFMKPADAESGETLNAYPALHQSDAFTSWTGTMETLELLAAASKDFSGVSKLGTEALALKVQGYTTSEIAARYHAPPSHVGAWASVRYRLWPVGGPALPCRGMGLQGGAEAPRQPILPVRTAVLNGYPFPDYRHYEKRQTEHQQPFNHTYTIRPGGTPMRKKSLYTAIGRFERRTNHKGQTYPVILLGGNEYMADLQEMALWTSLNWRIARREEIALLYEKTISRSSFSAERPLEACIQRLLMRGLIVCGTGETEYDALYDLLAALYVLPAEGSILQRACAFLKFSLRCHTPLSAARKLFLKDRRTENEKRVIGLARQALLSTAEIIKCFEKGIYSLPNEESIMDSLYDDEDTTSDNLPFLACTFPNSRAVVLAVANLYLRQQIIFERI